MIRRGMAVQCGGVSFRPVPGRVNARHDQPGRWWVTVCLGGWHQPQVFAEEDLTPLPDRAGLCDECAAEPGLLAPA